MSNKGHYDGREFFARAGAFVLGVALTSCAETQTQNAFTPQSIHRIDLPSSSQLSGIHYVPTAGATSSPLFYTYGGESGIVSSSMAASTSTSRVNATITSPPSSSADSWGWIASTSVGLTSWPAATYSVSLNVTKANSYLKIVGVKIYRVNSNGGPGSGGLAVVGQALNLSVSLGTAGLKSFTISGSAQTASASDKLAVKFYTANTSAASAGFAFDAGNGSLSQLATTLPISPPAPQPVTSPAPSIRHITVVIMENYDYEQVMGSSQAPFINQFATANALFTNSVAIAHPSEPNYLALLSGSTQGDTTDYCPLNFSRANLAAQLAAKGLRFTGYAENFPSATPYACEAAASTNASGFLYMRKHVPWADFTNIPTSDSSTYSHTIWSGSPSAQVNFVTPNLCNDMHDCGIASGDTWAKNNIPSIESWDNANNGLLILTFDEGEYSSTNHILTVFAGPMIAPGKYTQNISHYSVLRFIEKTFGLSYLGGAATASDITGILK